MNKMLPILALALVSCLESKQYFSGKITKILVKNSLTIVTLDTLASEPKPFGAIGHGEIWMQDINPEDVKSLLNKQVQISAICDGWVCRNVNILELKN